MWPLHPGLDNQYKLMFTVFTNGCLDVSDTEILPNKVFDHPLTSLSA